MKPYLDSMLWVYCFEGHPAFGPPTQTFVNRMRAARHEFLSSHLILAEVPVLPKRNRDIFTATTYRRFFLSSAVHLIPFALDPAERFADLRAAARVKPADALHLALAASAGADYFVTVRLRVFSKVPSAARAAVAGRMRESARRMRRFMVTPWRERVAVGRLVCSHRARAGVRGCRPDLGKFNYL
jgi:predicted nucleic acid-binding protein